MENFNLVIAGLLKREGGYVNHPADKGGPTNFGITLATLKAWRKKTVTATDVKNMTVTEAKQIYKANYWDKLNLDKVSYLNIAAIAFDQAVNRGPKPAGKAIQSSVNVIKKATGQTLLVVDGDIGPKSLNGITRLDGYQAERVCAEMIKEAQLNYVSIVRRNPSQIVFLTGWMNRTHELFDYIL